MHRIAGFGVHAFCQITQVKGIFTLKALTVVDPHPEEVCQQHKCDMQEQTQFLVIAVTFHA